jgi:multicomponent K+:H+ antiporter subunit A
MSLVLLATMPFLGALLVGLVARFGKNAIALSAAAATGVALFGILGHLPALQGGEVIGAQITWLPSAGLNAHFMLDGLGFLFALLILGIGLLIIIYARFYLGEDDPFARFFAFLMLFQGAMLGIVLSDNILLLLLFWELTSLTSFLLIGYWRHDADARQGARMALAVTGAGGLAMFAGLLLLGQIAGSFDLSVILTKGTIIQQSPLYLPALVLILLGAFAKSAQFPFHFWLPHAMAAPTPVSAYLHSATMVKAGLFLMARLWPVLAGSEAWYYIVATTGLVTMVYAAKVAIFKDDLKAILAFSTISHLGLITFLLGLGTREALVVAVFHIIAHATFKAPLFMVAGIVDHAAHTRDIRALGGLRHAMPITFALALLAAASMAGVPLLNGFLSKEMALEEAAHTVWAGLPWAVPILATVGAMFSVAYAFRFLGGVFFGPQRPGLKGAHDPQFGLWLSPAVLVVLVVVIGFVPMTSAAWLVDLAASAAGAGPADVKIHHWHGFGSAALWMSFAAFAGGFAVLRLYPAFRPMWDAFPLGSGKRAFDALLGGAVWAARASVVRLHDGALPRMMAIGFVTILALAAYTVSGLEIGQQTRVMTPLSDGALPLGAVLLLVLAIAVFRHARRLLALLMVGVIGLIISVGFAFLSAPDLALTQITVEVVTVILMLLALNILPKSTPRETGLLQNWGGAAIAIAAGLGAGGLALLLMLRGAAFAPISAFHLAQSKPGAGGRNAVNTIIVDFRGFDTYGEIIVLGIAAMIISALVEALLTSPDVKARLLPIFRVQGAAGDRHPMMVVVATRFLLPLGMVVGVYIYLRGHNLPGGGFVAGLVVSIAFLLQYIASGYGWSVARKRIDYKAMIGAGVLIASATGIGSWFAGRPFLTSNYAYVDIWPLEKFEVATAALFDLGVFLCVLGAVMLALANLARLAQAGGEVASKTPFDTAISKRKGR